MNTIKTCAGIAMIQIAAGVALIYAINKSMQRMDAAQSGLEKLTKYWAGNSSQVTIDDANIFLSEALRYISAFNQGRNWIAIYLLLTCVVLVFGGASILTLLKRQRCPKLREKKE